MGIELCIYCGYKLSDSELNKQVCRKCSYDINKKEEFE